MRKVDSIPNRDATMYGHPQRQHLLLPGRKDSNGRQVLDPRLGVTALDATTSRRHLTAALQAVAAYKLLRNTTNSENLVLKSSKQLHI